MASKIDGPSGPRPRFFIVVLKSFSAWYWPLYMASMQTDISEEVRSHQSNVISRFFLVLDHPQTNSSLAVGQYTWLACKTDISGEVRRQIK